MINKNNWMNIFENLPAKFILFPPSCIIPEDSRLLEMMWWWSQDVETISCSGQQVNTIISAPPTGHHPGVLWTFIIIIFFIFFMMMKTKLHQVLGSSTSLCWCWNRWQNPLEEGSCYQGDLIKQSIQETYDVGENVWHGLLDIVDHVDGCVMTTELSEQC